MDDARRDVDQESLWDIHEVANYLHVSTRRVHQLLRQQNRRFPTPVIDRAHMFLWSRADIERWRNWRDANRTSHGAR